jgi:hypothetical protein
MSPSYAKRRRFALALAAALPLCAHAACSSTNGDAVPDPVFDASPLDVGTNPDDRDGGGNVDGATKQDAGGDAPSDAPNDTAPNSVPVQINELYVDQLVQGDMTEFVELRAAPGTPVDDLKLRLINGAGVRYEVSAGVAGEKFGASGLWVVAGDRLDKLNVPYKVDRQFNITSPWGLDYPGAVQLVRGSTLLDVVGYSDEPDGGAVPQLMQAPTATVEGKPALAPDNAGATGSTKRKSFGRKTGALDTNDNSIDFCVMEASPGYAQKPCL